MRLNREISKLARFLANEHQSDLKNDTNKFRINFRYVFVHANVNEMPENVASRRILTKMEASIFH